MTREHIKLQTESCDFADDKSGKETKGSIRGTSLIRPDITKKVESILHPPEPWALK